VLLAPRVAEIGIAVAGPGPLIEQGVRAVTDAVADAGPLAGIAAGLAASARPWLLVVAGDMPAINGAVLDLLIGEATAGFDAVVPWIGGYPEPLLALYARTAETRIARRLAAGQRSVQAALSGLRVLAVDEAEVRAVDPDLATFRNLNYPDQL
jgi:molybdopterin-guanine dinucleotide biosynthesis protein A